MSGGFEQLEVWKRSKDLAVRVCRESEAIRSFGFRDQVVRSALSVPSNIAEGAERNSANEFALFLGYARGSLGELRTQLIIAGELGYFPAEFAQRSVEESRELGRMIAALIRSQRD